MTGTAGNIIYVPVVIGRDEYLKYYQGSAKNVYAHDLEGRSVSFPANILQPFVTHSGISGLFAITFDSGGKFRSIEKVAER